MAVSNTPIDIVARELGPRSGSKQEARFDIALGGMAGNAASVVRACGLAGGIVGVQGPLAGPCRGLAEQAGLVPYIHERRAGCSALTVARPSGLGASAGVGAGTGDYELMVQRMEPITRAEIGDEALAAMRSADFVVVGPMPATCGAALDLLAFVPEVAKHCALMAHPTLVVHPRFGELAELYGFVQMNFEEARPLAGGSDAAYTVCAAVREALVDKPEFAITNAGRQGWLRSAGLWYGIHPKSVRIVDDIGAGDKFAMAYLIARWTFGAAVEVARDYAVEVAAAGVAGAPIPAFGPAGMRFGAEEHREVGRRGQPGDERIAA